MNRDKNFGLPQELIDAVKAIREAELAEAKAETNSQGTPLKPKEKFAPIEYIPNHPRNNPAPKPKAAAVAPKPNVVVPDVSKKVNPGSVADYLKSRSKSRNQGPMTSVKPEAKPLPKTKTQAALPAPAKILALPNPNKPTHSAEPELKAHNDRHHPVQKAAGAANKPSTLPVDSKAPVDPGPKQTTVVVKPSKKKITAPVKGATPEAKGKMTLQPTNHVIPDSNPAKNEPVKTTYAKKEKFAKGSENIDVSGAKKVEAPAKKEGSKAFKTAAPLDKARMASTYKALTSTKTPEDHHAILKGLAADTTVRHAELDHLLRHHFGYDGPKNKTKTKGDIHTLLSGTHGQSTISHTAPAPKERKAAQPLPRTASKEEVHTHYLGRLRKAHQKGDHAAFAAAINDMGRDKDVKAPHVAALTKAYTGSLPTKSSRPNNINHMQSKFSETHGALKEEIDMKPFYLQDLLESIVESPEDIFSPEELALINQTLEG